MKDQFWQTGETISAGPQLVLRNVIPSDRDGFIDLQRKNSAFKGMLKEKIYCDLIWDEHTQDSTLVCSIVHEGEYIGYCASKDTTRELWEISIELQPEWTNRGIGRIAITAMLNEIKARLGVDRYRVRIEPTNYPSQRLFEGLGAVPNGISELWIHDQQILEACEEENLHHINDQLVAVADKFGVPPRKLLTHVLEYTLQWN